MKKRIVFILSLGAIIRPQLIRAAEAFYTLLASKNTALKPDEITKAIHDVSSESHIKDFKHGKLNEEAFTNKMITSLEEKTKVKLTHEEFDGAWAHNQPSYADYATPLQKAISCKKSLEEKLPLLELDLIFISSTNSKDIRKIIDELSENQVEHRVKNDELCSIAGIPLYTTYGLGRTKPEGLGCTKSELLEYVILGPLALVKQEEADRRDSCAFFQTQPPTSKPDVKYIRPISTQSTDILPLDADFQAENDELSSILKKHSVETLDWNEGTHSLYELLAEYCSVQSSEEAASTAQLQYRFK